jgi:hypothetical protein
VFGLHSLDHHLTIITPASVDFWRQLTMRTLAVFCALCVTTIQVTASDWPQFRGPGGQGHSDAKGIPLTWSETENIRWKVPIAGSGWSSPSIQGEQIWLTTATDEGKVLRAIALDRATGAVQHDVVVFEMQDPGPIHGPNARY